MVSLSSRFFNRIYESFRAKAFIKSFEDIAISLIAFKRDSHVIIQKQTTR